MSCPRSSVSLLLTLALCLQGFACSRGGDSQPPVEVDGGAALDAAVDAAADAARPPDLAAPAQSLGLCLSGGFCYENPLPQGNPLRGVYAASDDDVWLSGFAGTLLHYDGRAFTAQVAPGGSWVLGLWGSAANDIWGVGGRILHYDGKSWSDASPAGSRYLQAVAGRTASDVWAVGSSGVVMHYDGKTWTQLASGTTVTLHDVFPVGPSDVYMVGESGRVLHWDGTKISPLTIPGVSSTLYGVWGTSATDIWIVGTYDTLVRYDGKTFKDQGLLPGTGSFIGVVGTGPKDVWFFGEKIYHYDGTNLKPGPSLGERWYYRAGASAAGSIWAVGDAGVIARYKAGAWSLLSQGPTEILLGLWQGAASDLWIVGNQATLLRFDGRGLLPLAPPTKLPLQAVWGSSDQDVYAVGAQGTIVHYDGSRFAALTPPTAAWLYAVAGSGEKDVWVVGNGGTILHNDGAGFKPMTGGGTLSLTGVWVGGGEVFITGEKGTILRSSHGGPFVVSDSGITDSILAIAGTGPGDLWAVGEKCALHFDGAKWSRLQNGISDPNFSLTAVHAGGPTQVWAAGHAGLVMYYDGTQWNKVDAGTASYFNAVRVTPSGVFVAGEYGNLLRRR